MSAHTRSINLLPPSEFELSFWGKFLKWAVTAGRYIIILTELVVIGAFLSRFKLDRDLSLVSSEIEGEKNVLEASYKMETDFKVVQTRLLAVDKMVNLQLGAGQLVDRVVGNFSHEVKMDSLYVRSGEMGITGIALNEKVLGDTLTRLSLDDAWKSVELTNVEADALKGIRYTLRIVR
jgi:hypothetical protein